MIDDVPGHEPQPLFRADHRFELRPLGLDLLLALDLLPFGRLLEVRVDLRPFGIIQGQLGQTALVVDGHRGLVLHGPLDVVNADVIPEDGPGVGILQFNGRPRETDERGLGQGITHVPGITVDEVVLAAVRLVGDHDDVPPVRKHGVPVPLLLGEKLLDRGKDHSAGLHGQQLTEMGPAFRLNRRLSQKIPAA